MSAPRTRLDEATSDFERDMLAAWAEEQPSSRARDRALALAGGAAVAGAGAGAGATPAAVGGAHLLKWIVTVTILAGGAVAAPFVLERTSSHPHPSPPAGTTAAYLPAAATAVAAAIAQAPPLEPAPTVTSTAQPVAPRQVAAPVPSPPTVTGPAPVLVVPPLVPAPASPSATTPDKDPPAPDPPGGDTRSAHALGEQVALVDRARSALAGGNASSALRLADEYDARFPAGALAPEVAGLRVEALRIRRLRDAQ
jgi:hypothetical protein